MVQRSEKRQGIKRDTGPADVSPACESHEDIRTGTSAVALKQAILDNLFYVQGIIHGMLNAYWEPLIFQLPPAADGRDPWRRWIDTALPSLYDICRWDEAELVTRPTYVVQPRSVALLLQYASAGKVDG